LQAREVLRLLAEEGIEGSGKEADRGAVRKPTTPRSRALAWTAVCAATACLTSRR